MLKQIEISEGAFFLNIFNMIILRYLYFRDTDGKIIKSSQLHTY